MAMKRKVLYSAYTIKIHTLEEAIELKQEYKRITREGEGASKVFNTIFYLAAQISSAASKLVNLLTGAELSDLFSSNTSADKLYDFYDDVVDQMVLKGYNSVSIKYFEEKVQILDGKDDSFIYEGWLPANKLPQVANYYK